MKQITITLANDTSIFDTATFDDLHSALEWARGRGGQYHVGIGIANFVYDTDTNSYHWYNGDEWETVDETEIDRIAFPSRPRKTNDSKIAQARRAAGMTQQQLAEAIGVSWQQISNWERGDRNPKLGALQKIAEATGCKLEDLI